MLVIVCLPRKHLIGIWVELDVWAELAALVGVHEAARNPEEQFGLFTNSERIAGELIQIICQRSDTQAGLSCTNSYRFERDFDQAA